RVHRHASREVELSAGGRPAIAAVAVVALARDGDDRARRHAQSTRRRSRFDHLPNDVVACVGDEEVPRSVDRRAWGGGELGAGPWTTIAAVTVLAVARDSANGGRHDARARGKTGGARVGGSKTIDPHSTQRRAERRDAVHQRRAAQRATAIEE